MAPKRVSHRQSRLQKAEVRLQSAVARLEVAIQDSLISEPKSDERVVALEAELKDLKLKNTNFRTVNNEIGNSLDKVIDNLRSVLEK